MKEHNFLVEIGTDELPAKILKKIGMDFFNCIRYGFDQKHINCNTIKWFVAPRHLAVTVQFLTIDINDFTYKDNKLSDYDNQDGLSYSHINGVDSVKGGVSQQKSCLLQSQYRSKNDLNLVLIEIVNSALQKLMNYEVMCWSNIQIPFIRPVNTIIMLLDEYLIVTNFFGINSDRISYGHRYIKDNRIHINQAKDYPDILMTKGSIIVDYDLRKKIIQKKVQEQASKLGGVVDIRDNSFLEEIVSMVEYPVVLFGRFNKRFLSLPLEVMIYIMKEDQRYFPVYNILDGSLLPCFIFVINTITKSYIKIITDHEKVLKTRFMDAEFFLENDNQYRLEDYITRLDSIVFHRGLGSLRDKSYRISALSGWIAEQINEDILQAKRAGYLCKCDLMTDMVREFPMAQGIIGMYYARRDGELETVAMAQKEHYYPKSAKDWIPVEKISCIVSIADKMDTISGIFGVQEIPTSSRDPFALKRSASGLLGIIIKNKISLNLTDLIDKSVKLYGSMLTNISIVVNNIQKYMYKRLYSYYCAQGYRSDIVTSVLNIHCQNIVDCSVCIQSVHNFVVFKQKEYIQLLILYKRIENILKIQNSFFVREQEINTVLLKDPEEKKIFIQIVKTNKLISQFFLERLYSSALQEIVNLAQFANDFLNTTIIMDNNIDIKINRLLLIRAIKFIILRVIDCSVLKN